MKEKQHVYITRQIPESASAMLRKAGLVVSSYPESHKKIPRSFLLKKVRGVSAILSLLTDLMDGEVMDAAGPNLKVISNYAVGFDNIDVVAAKFRKIKVGNTPCEEVNEAVSEMAMTMIMAMTRNIFQGDAFIRAGGYRVWDPMLLLGRSLVGKTLGIVGLGKIGMGLAKRAADGFGLRLIYSDRARNHDFEKKYHAKFVSLPVLLKESDYVSLHVPLLPATHHLISTKEFARMKKTAYLINTARGPVVDELALNKALLHGDIAGAAIDVFECEPATDCNPHDKYELKKLKNIILTPHIASATAEAREKMAEIAALNIIKGLKGGSMPSRVG